MKIYYKFRTDTDEWPYPDEESRMLVKSILDEHFIVLKQIAEEICDKYREDLQGSSFAVLISYDKRVHKNSFIAIKVLNGQEEPAEKLLTELREKFTGLPGSPDDISTNKN